MVLGTLKVRLIRKERQVAASYVEFAIDMYEPRSFDGSITTTPSEKIK